MEVSEPNFSGYNSRSEQESSSDKEFSADDASVEIFAQNTLAAPPVCNSTRHGHGAGVHKPPRKKKVSST